MIVMRKQSALLRPVTCVLDLSLHSLVEFPTAFQLSMRAIVLECLDCKA